ncbi:hypothetical protein O6P43_026019 [Quillaja saponaria]|uniref:Uncharacterized protein n=1 Tax=Quillaja saponaria TaxID=32244 RepID=A0AAD7LAB8_QUISA|nr:hypothetical protein O6P43_026019 [Quillaja saponaria]
MCSILGPVLGPFLHGLRLDPIELGSTPTYIGHDQDVEHVARILSFVWRTMSFHKASNILYKAGDIAKYGAGAYKGRKEARIRFPLPMIMKRIAHSSI